MADRITPDEVAEMFGEFIPMEAVAIIRDTPASWTVNDLRNELRKIAEAKAVERATSTVGDVREQLRLLMLRQPITEERNTYSDGFQQGLALAVRMIDEAFPD